MVAAWGLCTARLGLFSTARVSLIHIRVSSLPQKHVHPITLVSHAVQCLALKQPLPGPQAQ
jgi:hypothetical protein